MTSEIDTLATQLEDIFTQLDVNEDLMKKSGLTNSLSELRLFHAYDEDKQFLTHMNTFMVEFKRKAPVVFSIFPKIEKRMPEILEITDKIIAENNKTLGLK